MIHGLSLSNSDGSENLLYLRIRVTETFTKREVDFIRLETGDVWEDQNEICSVVKPS